MKPKNDIIKTTAQINTMKEGGKLLAQVLNELRGMIRPDLPVWDLETHFIKFCDKHKVTPSCKGYAPFGFMPFPTGLCVSINDQSVHCYPKRDRILKEGDIISIDTVILHKGLNVDAAFCKGIGKISGSKQNLIDVTEKAMYQAIDKIKSGVRVGLISNTIEKVALSGNCDVLRDYAGHGIGSKMHEYPQIPCFGNVNDGPALITGMTICIETLVTEGGSELRHINNWETRTRDGKGFAIFEHTVAVTQEGYEILTTL